MPTRMEVAVHRVIDGDTFETTDGQRVRVRNVNAPELGSSSGTRAKGDLERQIQGRLVTLLVHARDAYGRLVAEVFVNGRKIA